MTTITLSDSRTLAYAEYGDPRGKPVFFFHGTPGSRLFRPPDEVTKKMGVRLICTDRPGYGQSTFQPGRGLLDWPADVAQLADALGLDKFYIAGHSGGGPHTLACAFGLPDRVTAAATLSGAGPVDAPGATDGMTPLNKFGFKFGRYLPWPVGRAITWMIFRERCADPAKAMDRETEIGVRPPADEEIITRPEVRDLCIKTEVEAFRPGLKGMAWDVRLITRPWGFRLDGIRVPVQLWHGTVDNLTSVPMAQHMAGKIPNGRLTIFPDEGHMLLFPHWEEILTALCKS
ncbi:MAG: alpha/beta hydrolase [Anaerolineaceae bacterium]|nr:MAG: alpha/beta hydrolase [Anaerolineaceae bacterium]